jgi:hypothetical protein
MESIGARGQGGGDNDADILFTDRHPGSCLFCY